MPYGSILLPLLFICYRNDRLDVTIRSYTFLYVEDTAILVKGKDLVYIKYRLESDLSSFDKWFSQSKLSMNQSKTKCMLFSSSRCPFKDIPLDIKQPNGNSFVEQTTEYILYLCIWLDPHLTFNNHMKEVCSKVKARTGILWRMRPFISQSCS